MRLTLILYATIAVTAGAYFLLRPTSHPGLDGDIIAIGACTLVGVPCEPVPGVHIGPNHSVTIDPSVDLSKPLCVEGYVDIGRACEGGK